MNLFKFCNKNYVAFKYNSIERKIDYNKKTNCYEFEQKRETKNQKEEFLQMRKRTNRFGSN